MHASNRSSEDGGLPRRPIAPVVTPVVVFFLTLTLIAWSAWPVLRPSRTIEVAQALLVTSNTQDASQAQGSPDPGAVVSTRTVQAAGWLEAEPFHSIATALTDGVIEEMLVLEGDRVEEGQVIASMIEDDARLRLARAISNHDAAKAALNLARARFVSAERNWDAPYELERAVDTTRAERDGIRAELAQLPSLIRIEEALLLQAQEELERYEKAYKSQASSELEFIAARESVNAQAARLEAIRHRESVLNASLARSQSELRAAERELELRIDDRERLDAARAQVQLAEAELAHRASILDEAQLELDRMTIRSPIDGYVQRRLKAPGDKVMLGMDAEHSAHILHLYDPTKIQVRVDVPLADASQIFVGQMCEVVVEVLPDRTFQGEVIIVTHEADLQKNTLQVKVRVLDPEPILRPEMLTRVKFLPASGAASPVSESRAAASRDVRVPASVVDTATDPFRVWVVAERSNGRGVLRSVAAEILSEEQDWVTIRADLHPGAIVAADPEACRPGERVRIATISGGAR